MDDKSDQTLVSPKANAILVALMTMGLAVAYVILMAPVSLHWGDRMALAPGDASIVGMPERDMAFWLWCMWWAGESIASQISPYVCPLQNFPFGVSLVFTPIAAPYGALFLPLRQYVNPIFMYNFWMTVLVVLTSLGAALLALEMKCSRRTAILAAALMFITPFQRAQMISHPNIASTAWPIFTLLFLTKLHRRGRWRYAMVAAFFAALTLYTSHYHFLFLGIIIGLSIVWIIAKKRSEVIRQAERRRKYLTLLLVVFLLVAPSFAAFEANVALLATIGLYLLICLRSQWSHELARGMIRFLLFAVLTLLLSAPLSLPLIVGEDDVTNDPAKSLSSKVFFSNTPITPLLTPMTARWLNKGLGIDGDDMWRFRADEEFASFPGWVALALVIFSVTLLRGNLRGKGWLFVGLCAYVLSMGPYVRFPRLIVSEHLPLTGIVLPGSIFFTFPMFHMIRVFSRLAFYFDFAIVMFAAVNFDALLDQLRRRFHFRPTAIILVLLAGVFVERFENGFPALRVQIPESYRKLSELPPGPMWFLPDHAVGKALFAQTLHGRPLANVLTSREDPAYSMVKQKSASWNYFQMLEQHGVDQPRINPEMAQQVREDLRYREIRYVVLMHDDFSAENLDWIRRACQRDLGLRVVSSDEELTVLSVDAPISSADH